MGRCINWEIHSPQTITTDQKRQIEALNEEMNAPDIKWTCENFWMNLDYITEKGKAFNFTKTAGNEWNTHLCVQGIIKLSRIIPENLIEVRDEGEYLYCPLFIKNGQAQPDLKTLKENIKSWAKEIHQHEKSPDKDIDLDNLIQSVARYQLVLSLSGKSHNPEKWYPVSLFCRKVNQADFDQHEGFGLKSIMSGFYGEYWDLSDKDPEEESYKMTSNIVRMLEKAGFNKDQIEIAPDLRNLKKKNTR